MSVAAPVASAPALPAALPPPTQAEFMSPAVHLDPYPFYARLRREAPVLAIQGPRGPGVLVSRYDDVVAVLKDERYANDSRRAGLRHSWLEEHLMLGLTNTMIMQDGQDHWRLRNLAHKAFTPARVEALVARMQELVDGMLDRMERAGQTELIADLALPLPLTVICELMGVPESYRATFHHLMSGLVDLDSGTMPALLFRSMPRMFRLFRYVRRLIEQRRRDRGQDLLSALIEAEEGGDRLSTDELVAGTFLLLLAGHETTVNLIGNGMLTLLEHPQELERLRADPSLAESTVEELLRFSSPVQMPAPRYAMEDVEVAGVKIPRGHSVGVLLASANRDETKFPDPDRLDLGRTPNKHVAFGFGAHYCVGALLARVEAKIAFPALARRFPGAALAVPKAQLRWRRSRALRGLEALPLRLR